MSREGGDNEVSENQVRGLLRSLVVNTARGGKYSMQTRSVSLDILVQMRSGEHGRLVSDRSILSVDGQ